MVTTASHHICSLTIFISCAFKGIQQSWTSCARSMPVWWKSWQTATASCSRRSTRGSHWRSATSRTCPSWRYGHPDARPVFLGCTSSSPAETKKKCTKFYETWESSLTFNVVGGCGGTGGEMGGGHSPNTEWGCGKQNLRWEGLLV